MKTTIERAAAAQPPRSRATASDTEFDVLIVGAGLSGVGAAYHLRERCPSARFAILEGRATMGGTWDLFRYPGIRSDSDMFTLGYSFRPWHSDKAISDGQTILDYIQDTARVFGIDKTIRYQHKVTGASWDSAAARWTVRMQRTNGDRQEELHYTCKFLYMCSGYYDYEEGHAPAWAQMEQFQGRIVHPQHWPEDLDYAGKRVVVIGSGATARDGRYRAARDDAATLAHVHRVAPRAGRRGQYAAPLVAGGACAPARAYQERAADDVLLRPCASQA